MKIWVKPIVLIFSTAVLGGCVSGQMRKDTKIIAPGSGGLSWRVSCDSKVERIDGGFKFVTNPNTCTKNGKITGTYNQRNEINTQPFSRNSNSTYIFESKLRFTSDSYTPAKIFQVHDATLDGCSPPLSVEVSPNHILLASAYKLKGDDGKGICLARNLYDTERGYSSRSRIDFPRDGSEHHFKVQVEFKGNEHFYVTVYLGGEEVIAGAYEPDVEAEDFMHSKRFYFKHGVYSSSVFDYELLSTDVSLRRID
ncbi:MAG: heparin lyase I family protein [Oceanospirillaceae bacterium]|nr:heparin lyase I family protein [Oceanospirillaceae bacterium]